MGMGNWLDEGEFCRAMREIRRCEPVQASGRIRQGDDANLVRQIQELDDNVGPTGCRGEFWQDKAKKRGGRQHELWQGVGIEDELDWMRGRGRRTWERENSAGRWRGVGKSKKGGVV